MKFVGTALRNANAEVRSAAGNVTVLVRVSEDRCHNCSERLSLLDVSARYWDSLRQSCRACHFCQ